MGLQVASIKLFTLKADYIAVLLYSLFRMRQTADHTSIEPGAPVAVLTVGARTLLAMHSCMYTLFATVSPPVRLGHLMVPTTTC